jgi:flagellar protein FliS
VEAAGPHKLIALLYDGALGSIVRARAHIEKGETAEKCAAITRALSILDRGLLASLNAEGGGELSENLRMMYEYMMHRLISANAKNDVALLDEVERLLRELQGAWAAIAPAA